MKAAIDRKKLIQAVQASRHAQGIDDETYRARLQQQFGVTSTKDLTDKQLADFRTDLNAGSRYQGKRRHRPEAPRKDQRLVYAMWRELRDLGGVTETGEKGLQLFLEAEYSKSAPEFMSQEETAKAAEALKAMIRRQKRANATQGKRHG